MVIKIDCHKCKYLRRNYKRGNTFLYACKNKEALTTKELKESGCFKKELFLFIDAYFLLMKLIPSEEPKSCHQKCGFFSWYRNYDYEAKSNTSITIGCELLDNEETYTREEGDKFFNDDFIYEDCPIRKYYDDNERYNLIKIDYAFHCI